ncbi:Hvo_1808 family surface protein [Haloplanus rubicundus]|uniref:Hvo_1808 family surface protein n=1 Tax=Haloplanus rubicundus TaxID=1547898 RepID=UPI0016514678|nr:Hvo_1808 family surface protein [Haloplanus rubicundus]
MRKRASAVLAVLMMVAAVAPVTAAAPAAVERGGATAVDGADVVEQRADPDEDVVGWEGGYWHNESIDVDQSDGLSDEELDAYVSRAMARVEYLRESEFDSDVPVQVLSREEFQRQRGENATSNASFDAWNDQVWEALFVIGEDREANEALQSATGETTAGFYAPSDDRIRIITDSPDSPTIDNATLVHELVHALQDQDGDLGERITATETQDAGLATDGVVEGEANYIEQRYTNRCGAEWDCVATPGSDGGAGEPPNLGILLTLLQPYSDGPVYIDWLIERGGWEAVEEAFDDPPQSTEQVIHLTDEEPIPIEYTDRARNGWETFPNQGEGGSDTVGEASMYVMFWYQARTARARTISPQSVVQTTSQYDIYNYDAEPSAGWGNDRVFPYAKGSGEDAQYGYVWVTEWDTEQDAAQFHNAYRAILDAHDAQSQGDNTYVVPSGEFADAFRIDRQGTTVTIVNAPTTEQLSEIRPAPESGGGDGASGDGDGGTAATSDGGDASTTATADDDESGSTGLEAPGFGPLTAVLALLAAVALVAVARRLN